MNCLHTHPLQLPVLAPAQARHFRVSTAFRPQASGRRHVCVKASGEPDVQQEAATSGKWIHSYFRVCAASRDCAAYTHDDWLTGSNRAQNKDLNKEVHESVCNWILHGLLYLALHVAIRCPSLLEMQLRRLLQEHLGPPKTLPSKVQKAQTFFMP